jgi:hypothetical protein
MRDRAEASIERAKGRMPEASVRATGTGSPEPALPTTWRIGLPKGDGPLRGQSPYATPPSTVAFATRPTPSM